MATFAERLEYLRSRDGLTLGDLARRVNRAPSAVSQWGSGLHVPDAETLERLADIFEVTVDYLLGRTDDPTPPGAKPKPAQHTNEEFRAFLRGRKLSDRDIELILQLEERMRRENEEKKKGQ